MSGMSDNQGWWVILLLLACPAVSQSADRDVIRVPEDYPTIQKAVDAAQPGDTIRVAAGIYAPSSNGEEYPITVGKSVKIEGAGAWLTILRNEEEDCPRMMLCASSEPRDFAVSSLSFSTLFPLEPFWGSSYLTFDAPGKLSVGNCSFLGLEGSPHWMVVITGGYPGQTTEYLVRGSYLTGANGVCVERGSTTGTPLNGVVKDNIFYRSDYPLLLALDGESGAVVEKNIFCYGEYIDLSNCDVIGPVSFRDNLVKAVEWGVNILGQEDISVVGNTIVSCRERGLTLGSHDPDQTRIVNNIICGNGIGVRGFILESGDLFWHNDVWGNQVNYQNIFPDPTGSQGNISLDPRFVSGPLGNFYLDHEESPCVNAGHPDYLPQKWQTTSSDHRWDKYPVDIGYHYPARLLAVEGKSIPKEY